MTAAALVAELRARGVELIPASDRIRYRPASAVPPDLVARLRACKAEVLCLLTVPPATVTLDPVTVSEVLGADADDPHAVACVNSTCWPPCARSRPASTPGCCPPVA